MDKIAMIREVRNQTGLGLRESKELVEEFQNGDLVGSQELMAKVMAKVKANPHSRSDDARKAIRDKVKGLYWIVEGLKDICEGDFDMLDLPDIREQTEKVADDALMIRDRLVRRLEDTLETEEVD
ncbi:hypothetical protein LCGC14_0365800 [marine sediment metagenome]|uniref:Large ribosomal subunit protein bL12 C-terminal domain-containing protein n=1 Tax=marine sediment metagenome TaxID=412755 RepID=A0A0F9WF75_9ZZZZ